MYKHLSKISIFILVSLNNALCMHTVHNFYTPKCQRHQSSRIDSSFFRKFHKMFNTDTEKPLLLLTNESKLKEELLYDNMLSNDTKNIIMSNLDFKSERAYWCTNKENNHKGHSNWRQREKLNPLLVYLNDDRPNAKIQYIYNAETTFFYVAYKTDEHDFLTAAIVTRSHEKLRLLLKKREDLFSKGFDLKFLPSQITMRIAKLLARQMIDKKRIQFFESKEHSSIAIRERNMAAIELLLEHQCNLHRISKEINYKKFYDIEGYKNYLDRQVKEFLEAIEISLVSDDVEYFKLLVKHVHPDIINNPIQKRIWISCIKNECLQETSTVLDYVYRRYCAEYALTTENIAEQDQSLINFLIKYGALTYEELMKSTPQTNMYGF